MTEVTAVEQYPAIDLKSVRRQKLYLLVSTSVFSLWVIAMLVMYFTTVYPQRHPQKMPPGTPSGQSVQ